MRRFACAALVLAVVVAACSGGTSYTPTSDCTSLFSAATTVQAKIEPCFPDGGLPSLTGGVAEAQCAAALSSAACSSNDINVVGNFAACLNGLPTCSASTEGTFIATAELCVSEFSNDAGTGLSAGCSAALNPDGGT